MPPPDSNKKLTAAQKRDHPQVDRAGAKYQKHWSFEPIRRPAVPKSNRSANANRDRRVPPRAAAEGRAEAARRRRIARR